MFFVIFDDILNNTLQTALMQMWLSKATMVLFFLNVSEKWDRNIVFKPQNK